ncbi:MAG TPA: hypothetical protein PLN41_03060 [Methanothrix sp.]|jgi:hypothetical protein|nr:hypothetical protein [Methanothrix sp.]
MDFKSVNENKLKCVVYSLVIILLVLAIGSLIIFIVIETAMVDSIDFTAIGAISNVITAIIGIPLLAITLSYLLATREMVQEMRKQRAIMEEPAVSLKAVPSADAANVINLVLKNTGGGPAYDVSVKFDPDIPYEGMTLNQLNMFRKMSVLDKGESVELFFASAPEYFKSKKPKRTTATIEYYIAPNDQSDINSKPLKRNIVIDLEERRNQLQLRQKNMNDLVEEIIELKQGVLFIASNINENGVDEK